MRRTWIAPVVAAAVVAVLGGCTTAAPAPSGAASPSPSPSRSASAPPSEPVAVEASGAPAGTPSPSSGNEFSAAVTALPPEVVGRVTGVSWREGCPVALADLRYVTVTHRTFDGTSAPGELVVHADVADGLVDVFRTLFDAGYPIRSMRLVDDFGASDDASMAADNTSAFNCRPVAGTDRWSEHSYGRAIDVNPVENPWVSGRSVAPPSGAPFVDRRPGPGVILPDDVVVRAFAAAGWSWGGSWTAPKDYQHFSTTGR